MIKAWSRFWFADAPYFDLALMRMLFVGLQMFLLLLWSYEGIQYVSALPDAMWLPLPTFQLVAPWAHGARPSVDFVMLVYWSTWAVGALAFVGFLTGASTLAFALGNIYLQSYQYSFGEIHHTEAIMMIALLAIALGPSGRVLSVDDWIRTRRAGPGARRVPLLELRGPDAGWPIRMMQCFIPMMYMSAAFAKLTLDGRGWSLDWANGVTLQKYLAIDGVRWASPLAVWASQFHVPLLIGQWVVLVFQVTYFVTIFSRRARWIYIPLGLVFHIGIYLTLRAAFPQWIAASAFYVPWSVALAMLMQRSTTAGSTERA